MKIQHFDIWLADLEPQRGTETGKVRPVLVVQTNLLNSVHPSTIICPLTTQVQPESTLLRVHIARGVANMDKPCDVMIDQVRAIDNRRLLKKIGELPHTLVTQVKQNLGIVMSL